jgi:hypothetical protein
LSLLQLPVRVVVVLVNVMYHIPSHSALLCHRLAAVRFGSGSGVLGLNLNLHNEVRF